MYLIAAAFVFAAYFANIALGAFADSAVLGDLGEMILLFIASILFVVAIIRAEAKSGRRDDQENQREEHHG